MNKKLVVIVFFLFGNLCFSGQNETWHLSKNDNGIRIYTRLNNGSDFKEYKAITKIYADRSEVVNMVLNISQYVKWFPDCMESELVEKIDENTIIVYYLIDSPWPSSNRDAVVRLDIERSPTETKIQFRSAKGYKRERDDAVRIPKTKGYWQFIDGNGYTKVIYQNHADPGGSVPAWIANLFVVDGPYETLVAMKKRLQ